MRRGHALGQPADEVEAVGVEVDQHDLGAGEPLAVLDVAGHRAGGARRAAADVRDLDAGHRRCSWFGGRRARPFFRPVAHRVKTKTDHERDIHRPQARFAWSIPRTGRSGSAGSLDPMTTASAEQAVLDGVPTRLFIGGDWRDAGGGRTLPVEDPATGETLAEVADATVDGRRGGARRRRRGLPELPRRRAARARRDPAPRLRADDRAHRRARAADDARDGQAAGRVARRGRLRGVLLPLVRRGGGAHQRPLPGRRERASAAC